MDYSSAVFYFFSFILLFSAIKVITSRNPIFSALFLVLSFFSAAGLWLLLQAEFLAIALVLVYVGAVMVLFLFVIMMIDINIEVMKKGFWNYFPAIGFVSIIMLTEIILVLNKPFFKTPALFKPPLKSNTDAIGEVLYSDYILPFEIAAIILLVAIIAAIALTLRGKKMHKGIDPTIQISVKKSDRLKMVDMGITKTKTKKRDKRN